MSLDALSRLLDAVEDRPEDLPVTYGELANLIRRAIQIGGPDERA